MKDDKTNVADNTSATQWHPAFFGSLQIEFEKESNKLIFDVNHKVRLVDTEAYSVGNAEQLYGLGCGILATNYDVKDLFIDSALRICKDDVAAWVEFMTKLNQICEKYEVQCTVTSSIDQADLPKSLEQFVF